MVAADRERIRTRSIAIRRARAPGRPAASRPTIARPPSARETDGSVTSPSSACGLVGIKPTVGLIGRSGIIPISHSQDTAGPMTRTVRDAAILLGALTGVDPRDDATKASAGKSYTDYTTLSRCRTDCAARGSASFASTYMGYSPKTDKLVEQAIDVLKQSGATIVDPANLPAMTKIGDAEVEVLLYELKADLNAYLDSLGAGRAVQDARRRHHVQRAERVARDAVLRPGDCSSRRRRRVHSPTRSTSRRAPSVCVMRARKGSTP